MEIGRATLDGWVMRVGELLVPVVEAMRKELLQSSYLQADETTLPVQMKEARGSNHQAYLWQYGKPGGETVFDFCLGRGREGPRKFLGPWEGILQTDGYQAYEGVGGPKMVHVGCWAHYPESAVIQRNLWEAAHRGAMTASRDNRTPHNFRGFQGTQAAWLTAAIFDSLQERGRIASRTHRAPAVSFVDWW